MPRRADSEINGDTGKRRVQFDLALGRAIAAARKKRGLSQHALAHALGVVPSSMSLMETGARVVSMYRALKISSILKVPLAEIVAPAVRETSQNGNR